MTILEWETISWLFVTLAFETVLRSSILAVLCGCAAWLLRSKTAEFRWTLWRWTLLALFALPFLMHVTPPMVETSHAVSSLQAAVIPTVPQDGVRTEPAMRPQTAVPSRNRSNAPIWVIFAPALYLLVTLALLARLALNLFHLRWIARHSELIRDAHFSELAHEIWLKSGAFLRPRVSVSKNVTAPVTFNADDTWILLPPSWPEWSEAKLRAVLTHEMAHVRRDDSAHLQFASFMTCIYWFHPLSWFLRQQLAALAEEACDEAVVANGASPEQYANFLIDFARDVKRGHGRLVVEATAFVRGTSLKRRIERMFAVTQSAQRGRKLSAYLAFLLFFPALYLAAAVQIGEPQQEPKIFHDGKIIWPNYSEVLSLSPAEVAAKESAVQSNPEDLNTRMELVVYYAYNNQPFYIEHLLWFIAHHPDIETLPMAAPNFRYLATQNPAAAEQIQSTWQEAMAKHPDSPVVIFNAASFIKLLNPARTLQLLRKARALDPKHSDKYDSEVTTIYTAAEIEPFHPNANINGIQMTPDTGGRLRSELETSSDPALLAAAGKLLVELRIPPASEEQNKRGLELIQQAIQLDPGNPKWTEALEWAKAEPQRRLNYENTLRASVVPSGVVRIGAKVAEANLVSKTDPVYPPLALQARVQGTVEFTVTVGPEGKVQNLFLVRGHPLLVNAAKEAVLKWVYHPTTVDGKPIPFQTQVLVPFQLNQ